MPRIFCTVTPDWNGRSVAACLRGILAVSSALLRRRREVPGAILRNGEPTFLRTVCVSGDVLSLDVSDGSDPDPGSVPQFPVLWRDPFFALCEKPAGMLSHPSTLCPGDKAFSQYAEETFGAGRCHMVNRLDRGTSGLTCIALCGYMHERLKSQLHTDGFIRTYLCICEGCPDEAEGVISVPIGRAGDSVIRRAVRPDGDDAVTYYRVLRRGAAYSLCLARPRTGRTHQIRVHFAHIGHPLAGDFLYGKEENGPGRLCLHSAAAEIRHPVTGECVRAFCPLPTDLSRFLHQCELDYAISEEDIYV